MGPEFGIKSKEDSTCEVFRQEGPCAIQCELWTKVEPAFSITGPFTLSPDAYCYEKPLKGCFSVCLRLLRPLRTVPQTARLCEPGQCPPCRSCLGMEQSVCTDSSNNHLPGPRY